MTAPLRIGVIGGGLVAQAVHLPNLARLGDRFAIAAIADPSARVSGALAARYAPAVAYADWRAMLAAERLDAVVVCSPNGTHAEVVGAAIDHGLHVLVEKPVCLVPEDADALARAAAERDVVVMVGYMKRYHAGYTAFVDALPATADGLRLIDVLTYDPWMAREPFVPWSSMVHGDDVPTAVIEATRAQEREQVARALGRDDPEAVSLYSLTFLGALIHDVNLVHGFLEAMGEERPVRPLLGGGWNDWKAAAVTLALPNGGQWRSAWLLLEGLSDFRETADLYFDDAVHRLTFGAPYLHDPAQLTRLGSGGDAPSAQVSDVRSDAFLRELAAFHACVVDGAENPTPVHQARKDVAVLRDLFLAGG